MDCGFRMGRNSGFIALHACLAARHADIVLLPEMKICSLVECSRCHAAEGARQCKTVRGKAEAERRGLEKVLQHCLELMQWLCGMRPVVEN